jgi:hypothetical protein
MPKALLISTQDVAKYTALNANVDRDLFIQYLSIAQDIHIQNYLGTDLLEAIQLQIETSGAPTGVYADLVSNYIKPMLCAFAMVEFLPFSAYTIANKGVYKHSAENSETIDRLELDNLIDRQNRIAENYAKRFTEYICNYSNLFPEYNTNSNGDVQPSKDVNFSNWFL